MLKQIKQFLRPRFIQWQNGLDDTKETFWLWWLAMHPDYCGDDFWSILAPFSFSFDRILPPWDLYLSARHIHKDFFDHIEAVQGSNVWGRERIDWYLIELMMQQKKTES